MRGSIRLVAGLGMVFLAAYVFGWQAFALTAVVPRQPDHSNPVCVGSAEHEVGFDPWTGLPHGRFYTCPPAPHAAPTVYFQVPLPDDMVGRRAIPVPVGFAVGTVLAGGVWYLLYRRSRVERFPKIGDAE